jgi:hypothetical protein
MWTPDKPALYLVAALAISAATLGAVAWHASVASAAVSRAVEAERQALRDTAGRALAAASERAIRAETQATIAAMEMQIDQDNRNRQADDDRQRAGAERGRLLDTIAALRGGGSAPGQTAGAGSLADAAPALATALSECSQRYEQVAGIADRAIIQVMGLQDYITKVLPEVCPASP